MGNLCCVVEAADNPAAQQYMKYEAKNRLLSITNQPPPEREDALESALNKFVNTGSDIVDGSRRKVKQIENNRLLSKNKKKMDEVRNKYNIGEKSPQRANSFSSTKGGNFLSSSPSATRSYGSLHTSVKNKYSTP